eukprot:6405709-Pyramimonas_sp.AAC.1
MHYQFAPPGLPLERKFFPLRPRAPRILWNVDVHDVTLRGIGPKRGPGGDRALGCRGRSFGGRGAWRPGG